MTVKRGSAMAAKILCVPSVEPSSTTISSRSSRLCPRTLFSVSAMKVSALNAAITTVTLGDICAFQTSGDTDGRRARKPRRTSTANKLETFSNGGGNASRALCRADGPIKQIGRDTKCTWLFRHVMAVKDEPSAGLYGLSDQTVDIGAIERSVLQRPGVKSAQVRKVAIDAGVARTTGIKARFEKALRTNGKIAIGIGKIS